MNSGVHGQRRNVESDACLQAKIQETEDTTLAGLRASVPLPPVLTLFIGTEPYRFLPEENGVQDGQRARNPSPIALASCLLVGEDLGSCHRTVLNSGGVSSRPPTLGVSSRH